jgi:hypothetical protein
MKRLVKRKNFVTNVKLPKIAAKRSRSKYAKASSRKKSKSVKSKLHHKSPSRKKIVSPLNEHNWKLHAKKKENFNDNLRHSEMTMTLLMMTDLSD